MVTCCPRPPRATAAAILDRTSATRSARPGKAIASKFSGARAPIQLSAALRRTLLAIAEIPTEALQAGLTRRFYIYGDSSRVGTTGHTYRALPTGHRRTGAPLVFERESAEEGIAIALDSDLWRYGNLDVAHDGHR